VVSYMLFLAGAAGALYDDAAGALYEGAGAV
jgi:hypothetical protein